MIPRTIHYCWYGDRPMPAAHRGYVEGWRRMLPGYEFVFWNEDNSPMHLRYIDTARAGRRWVNLSNFIRLCSVYHHGGVYLDTDVESSGRWIRYCRNRGVSSGTRFRRPSRPRTI